MSYDKENIVTGVDSFKIRIDEVVSKTAIHFKVSKENIYTVPEGSSTVDPLYTIRKYVWWYMTKKEGYGTRYLSDVFNTTPIQVTQGSEGIDILKSIDENVNKELNEWLDSLGSVNSSMDDINKVIFKLLKDKLLALPVEQIVGYDESFIFREYEYDNIQRGKSKDLLDRGLRRFKASLDKGVLLCSDLKEHELEILVKYLKDTGIKTTIIVI